MAKYYKHRQCSVHNSVHACICPVRSVHEYTVYQIVSILTRYTVYIVYGLYAPSQDTLCTKLHATSQDTLCTLYSNLYAPSQDTLRTLCTKLYVSPQDTLCTLCVGCTHNPRYIVYDVYQSIRTLQSYIVCTVFVYLISPALWIKTVVHKYDKAKRDGSAIPSNRRRRRFTFSPGSKGVRTRHYVTRVWVCIHDCWVNG